MAYIKGHASLIMKKNCCAHGIIFHVHNITSMKITKYVFFKIIIKYSMVWLKTFIYMFITYRVVNLNMRLLISDNSHYWLIWYMNVFYTSMKVAFMPKWTIIILLYYFLFCYLIVSSSLTKRLICSPSFHKDESKLIGNLACEDDLVLAWPSFRGMLVNALIPYKIQLCACAHYLFWH